jgi:integrase
MGILVECPICHRKQSTKNKHCAKCGDHLDKQKRNGKARYWVIYRIAGKERREFAGYSVQEARDAEGKRKGQKREGRILEMLPQSRITFGKLSEWYLSRMETEVELTEAARAKGKMRKGPSRNYFARLKTTFKTFNVTFGDTLACDLTEEDLKRFCAKRERLVSPYTLDVEIVIVRSMVNAAFDADKVDGRVLKIFRKVKSIATLDDMARKRAVSIEEYMRLLPAAPSHLRAMMQIAMHTGMRHGEIRKLQWSHIDRKAGIIQLTADITKNKRPRMIPLTQPVRAVLDALPRHLHGFVLTYRGQLLKDASGIKTSLKQTCKVAGVPYGKKTPNGLVFHDLRRSAKTNMVKAGVNKIYRDLLLGHSLEGMDVNYIVESGLEEELRQAMEQYAEWLGRQFQQFADQNADQVIFN